MVASVDPVFIGRHQSILSFSKMNDIETCQVNTLLAGIRNPSQVLTSALDEANVSMRPLCGPFARIGTELTRVSHERTCEAIVLSQDCLQLASKTTSLSNYFEARDQPFPIRRAALKGRGHPDNEVYNSFNGAWAPLEVDLHVLPRL